MDVIDRLKHVAGAPGRYAGRWRAATGRPVLATFCSYAPEEIILAGGALAYRILGAGEAALTLADTHLQAYSCSLVRGALAEALDGGLDFLDGAVFPHTCDSIQRLSDIWRLNTRFAFHADVVLPVKLNTDSAAEYMTALFRRFRESLERFTGRDIGDAQLREAIEITNRIRSELEGIYLLRRDSGGAVPGGVVDAIVKASMVMDRRELADLLPEARRHLARLAATGGAGKKRILLSGGVCSLPDLYGRIEAAGGTVVWDDLCTGSRYFGGRVANDGDPVEAMSRRYLRRAVCPAKHAGLESRARRLIRLVGESGAQGVIFLFLKFCDPHLFDYPYLKGALEDAGIPSLFFEIEDRVPSAGQFRTRCEAFLEML